MKTLTYTIFLGLMLVLFVGCGEGSSTHEDPPAPSSNTNDVPKSPVLGNKEKVPPSIPNI